MGGIHEKRRRTGRSRHGRRNDHGRKTTPTNAPSHPRKHPARHPGKRPGRRRRRTGQSAQRALESMSTQTRRPKSMGDREGICKTSQGRATELRGRIPSRRTATAERRRKHHAQPQAGPGDARALGRGETDRLRRPQRNHAHGVRACRRTEVAHHPWGHRDRGRKGSFLPHPDVHFRAPAGPRQHQGGTDGREGRQPLPAGPCGRLRQHRGIPLAISTAGGALAGREGRSQRDRAQGGDQVFLLLCGIEQRNGGHPGRSGVERAKGEPGPQRRRGTQLALQLPHLRAQ
mmetsp:Transcript_5672/g.35262  ORF Transcript_5672/g.35262 Transcript_5672/m.35262 type:complete len:288 (+) Transcript_5672:748-1611(+)